MRELRDRSTDGTRGELVDGELLVTPSPTGAHQNAALLLWAKLYPYVRAQRLGQASAAPKDVGFPSEYWIVDPEARVFERWRPDDDRPEIIADRIEWNPSGSAAPFVLELAAYFAEVWMEDLDKR